MNAPDKYAGQGLAYYPKLSLLTGSMTATLLLSQLISLFRSSGKHRPDTDGWMFFKRLELEEMLRLSEAELKTARKVLRQRKLTAECRKGRPPKIGIRILWESFKQFCKEGLPFETSFLAERRKAKYVPPKNKKVVIKSPKQRVKVPGFVYLIHAIGTNRYKIGRTQDVAKRFKTLKQQAPFPLELIHSLKVLDAAGFERKLHLKYAAKRKHDEWFELTAAQVKAIKNLVEEA